MVESLSGGSLLRNWWSCEQPGTRRDRKTTAPKNLNITGLFANRGNGFHFSGFF
jgi:hypothetical protein